MTPPNTPRRVVLLETDERAGLVAALADACAAKGVSLDITTGPGHVLLTFQAVEDQLLEVLPALQVVPGVESVHSYTVQPGRA